MEYVFSPSPVMNPDYIMYHNIIYRLLFDMIKNYNKNDVTVCL